MKHKNIHIFNIGKLNNKGDYAILKSMIYGFKKIDQQTEISLSAQYPVHTKKLISDMGVYPEVINTNIEKDYNSIPYKISQIIFPLMFIVELLMISINIFLIKLRIKPIYKKELFERISKTDIFLSKGGSFIFDSNPYHKYSLYSKIFIYLLLLNIYIESRLAKKIYNRPYIIFLQTLGPFNTKLGRFFAKRIFDNCTLILLRDKKSIENIKNLTNLNKVKTFYDSAFILPINEKNTGEIKSHSIGISPRFIENYDMKKYVQIHSDLANHFIKDGFNIYLLPSNVSPTSKINDLIICNDILSNLEDKSKAHIINPTYPEDYKYYLSKLDFLISTRMHPIILALSTGVSFIMINYEIKQEGLLENLDLGKNEFSISVKDIDIDRLIKLVEKGYKNRLKNRKFLQKNTKEIQKKINEAFELVCNL